MHYKNDTSSGQTRKPPKKASLHSQYAEDRKEARWLARLAEYEQTRVPKTSA